MFKFNFSVDPNEEGILKNDLAELVDADTQEQLTCYDCDRLSIKEDHVCNMESYDSTCFCDMYGSIEIKYLNDEAIKEITQKKSIDIKVANDKHSDLLPGIYEGGAKIWECTIDLLKYMSKNMKTIEFTEKRILDLGCGAGLLGIYALKNGGIVEFQDYNKDVLETITISNVLLNVPKTENILNDSVKRISFYSGDWSKYLETTIKDEKFDLILTSETIYNMKNYSKLINTFKEKLKRGGKILLAAKIYYFGVGGGIRQFEEHLKSDGVFISESIWESTVNVPREILEIRYKDL